MFPLVREMAAADAPIRVPVVVACRVLGRSTQGYYQWLQSPVCDRDLDDAYLINAALDITPDVYMPTTQASGTGSSPTSSPSWAWWPRRTGSGGCVRSSGSSRRTPRSGV